MTTAEFDSVRSLAGVHADPGVYEPQQDSLLLCDVAAESGLVSGARVLDMCTGSGAVAITAALLGARDVMAFDISPRAVACAQRNARSVGVDVDVRLGSFSDAAEVEPFDVLLCNPPYVPSENAPTGMGVHRAWDAGEDGRVVLDPLCTRGAELLVPGGVILVVHSEFSGSQRTREMLGAHGFGVSDAACRTIDFGPVMMSRAEWLEARGLLEPGRRTEELVVLRGDKR
ncbi:HemK2/MTQ2 family protein methyltransferase [Rhodococcus sp. ARC_M5]|uniref:HemK2/MTQ2 family protein methyltransferase n=1 Tax=Rhodococcus sp. ARC_M5 TaxID=2928851 RepID=UPI001FB396DF|nr:HemK2/MTQ2 family protein methyltransferase [Rhodococcus sp. ARC_M5]MCJ0890904.1 methyltransferase [Rhodococcus sp. ARC_M5]